MSSRKLIKQNKQKFYVGKAKYTFDEYGNVTVTDPLGNSKDVVVCNGQTLDLPCNTVNNSDKSVSEEDAKKLFAFLAKNTKVEWAMTIGKDGNAKVYTSHHAGSVGLSFTSDSAQVVHSHTSAYGGELSPEDTAIAGSNSDIIFTLYYDGYYENYGSVEFYGGTYQ